MRLYGQHKGGQHAPTVFLAHSRPHLEVALGGSEVCVQLQELLVHLGVREAALLAERGNVLVLQQKLSEKLLVDLLEHCGVLVTKLGQTLGKAGFQNEEVNFIKVLERRAHTDVVVQDQVVNLNVGCLVGLEWQQLPSSAAGARRKRTPYSLDHLALHLGHNLLPNELQVVACLQQDRVVDVVNKHVLLRVQVSAKKAQMVPVLLQRLLVVQTVQDVRETVGLEVVLRFGRGLLRQVVF